MNTNKPATGVVVSRAVLATLVLLQLAATTARAQNTAYAYWQTNADGNWSDASNWQRRHPRV